jgi:hypothetical protein
LLVDWNTHYSALLHFCNNNGHCKVPRRLVYQCELPKGLTPEDGTIHYTGKLGRWLDDQRKAKKGKRSRLLPEREALLQRLVDDGSY